MKSIDSVARDLEELMLRLDKENAHINRGMDDLVQLWESLPELTGYDGESFETGYPALAALIRTYRGQV